LLPGSKPECIMGRGALLWLIGVPLPIVLLLWFFFFR
jgi:hypothetical protein